MVENIRSFIAIALDQRAVAALRQLQDALGRKPGTRAARWTAPGSIHLTLKFLGDVPADDIPVIAEALRERCSQHGPFRLVLAGLGCFPDVRQPRIVWVGLQGETAALLALQREVDQVMDQLGYPPERRPFSPHLTIARVHQSATRSELETLGQAVERSAVGELAALEVEAVHLVRSDLRPEGPIYTDLAALPLAGK
ncbi:MAG: RNA 2',3'-cyclic phosphodiesterase [Chloroflexi bacterium]|nr:RNA 2',3'-cyclic phosphodiesterase [Chloroflexota bacterium]